MSRFLSTIAFMGNYLALPDEGKTILFDGRWDYYRRGLLTCRSPINWVDSWGWRFGTGFLGGDPSTPLGPMGQRESDTGSWSPWAAGPGGNASRKYIMGQCKDGIGNPIGGAVVAGFITATNECVGVTATDDQGRYELGCPKSPGDQHYLVAYVDSSPDLAGTTVNTLVPTNRDGT